MIVRLVRPSEPPVGPWLLYAPGGVLDAITPTAELARRMEGPDGYFRAMPTAEGWDIWEAVDDPHWSLDDEQAS